jgi:hypothetical protein
MDSEVYPRDFFEREAKIDPKLCFILSPFKEEYEGIREAINTIVRECDFEPARADDIRRPGIIHSDIWDHIQRAAVIIADVTEHNPNVFFELGVASTIKDKSRVIIIRQPGSGDEYPFDIGPFRCIHYENTIPGARKLAEDLKSYLRTIRREDDALWDVLDKMREWQEYDHEYDFLLTRTDLKRIKRLPWVNRLDREVAAYALASSMLHTCDCKFWTDLNRSNMKAAEPLAYMIYGAYRRPRFRSAYALQYMEENLRAECLKRVKKKVERAGGDNIIERLIQSIESLKVEEFVKEEAGKSIEQGIAQELLSVFDRWDVI